MWTRRAFVQAAGIGFVASLTARPAEALQRADLVFATAGKRPDGSFAAGLVSDRGELIATLGLPDRGHDVTQCPVSGRFVAFARRPGTFAVVFDRQANELSTITSPPGRHFFGHGIFAPDGKLLYATENDFENSQGIIGIYDATDNFRRIGEFFSGGIGPHDIVLGPDSKLICVANGGIETHPDFGRTKLNLSSMQSNLAWIDRDSGGLIAIHDLPPELHQLSLRHLAMGAGGKVWVGGQYQGDRNLHVPLLASASPDDPLEFANLPEAMNERLSFYVGSVAASPDGSQVMATSPVGNVALIFDVASDEATLLEVNNVCGADWGNSQFAYSTGDGAFFGGTEAVSDAGLYFDNHLLAARQDK